MEYCILGDWETYYAFDNTFNIDLDLDDVLIDARKEDKSIELNSKNIMSFDRDILDYGYTYEDIIDYISQISDDEIKITDISEKSSLKNRTITMKINEKEWIEFPLIGVSESPISGEEDYQLILNCKVQML